MPGAGNCCTARHSCECHAWWHLASPIAPLHQKWTVCISHTHRNFSKSFHSHVCTLSVPIWLLCNCICQDSMHAISLPALQQGPPVCLRQCIACLSSYPMQACNQVCPPEVSEWRLTSICRLSHEEALRISIISSKWNKRAAIASCCRLQSSSGNANHGQEVVPTSQQLLAC